jgi:transposase
VKGLKYKTVNEFYTSKMCSVCGEIDANLGGKKKYACANCKTVMDRDVNGCRGIYIKQYM